MLGRPYCVLAAQRPGPGSILPPTRASPEFAEVLARTTGQKQRHGPRSLTARSPKKSPYRPGAATFPVRRGRADRGRAEAADLLGDYSGNLQTDGYLGYEALGEKEGIRRLGCMAHVRRKLVEVERAVEKKGQRRNGSCRPGPDRQALRRGARREKKTVRRSGSRICESKNPDRCWTSLRRCSMPASPPPLPRACSARPSATSVRSGSGWSFTWRTADCVRTTTWRERHPALCRRPQEGPD